MEQLWYVVGFAFAGVSFVFLTIGAAWLVSHRNQGDVHKGLPYESGIDTYGDTHGRFGLSFYIYALLFVAFDIEVIFIYLWAIVFKDPNLIGRAFISMLVFVGDPVARPRLCVAEGSPDMAVNEDRVNPDGSGAGPADATEIASDVPAQPGLPATRSSDEVMAPIVVPNTLWQSTDPLAYEGSRRPTSPTSPSSRRAARAAATTHAGVARSRSSRPRPITSWT